MTSRQQAAFQKSQTDAESNIRQVAGKSPGDPIADAKRPLDAGTTWADKHARLKTKALA
jgi:hypothetical protein